MARPPKYSKEVKEFIILNSKGNTTKELVNLVNEKFGLQFTVAKMRSYKGNYNLRSDTPRGRRKGCMTSSFPKKINDFILENHKGCGPTLMTALLNETFGTSYEYSQIKWYYKRHKLQSGVTGALPKDYLDSKENMLKYCVSVSGEGIDQAGYLSIGTERIDSHGYVEVKISSFPSKWKGKHHLVWEAHNGPIPDGNVVIFADRNKFNISIDNLILLSKRQMFIMSRNKLFQPDADLTKTGVAVAKVFEKIYERR